MLYESTQVRVEAVDGVATLWLEFPGEPVNALTPVRLAELDRALGAALPNPHLDVLVLRSGRPAGFCGGHDPAALRRLTTEADATAFAVAGQRVLNRLAGADVVSVAYLEGPCLGPGLELALACDYRVAVGGPDSWLGFPDAAIGVPPCWGGAARLPRLAGRRARGLLRGKLVTVREAWQIGLVDRACSERRGKIELRTLLDRLQSRPRKRTRPTSAEVLARERMAFRSAAVARSLGRLVVAERSPGSAPPLPELVVFRGSEPVLAELAVEAILRGSRAAVIGEANRRIPSALEAVVRRGRVTPLEAEQALSRLVTAGPDTLAAAGLEIAGHAPPVHERLLRPRAILAVPATELACAPGWSRPGRVVGLDFADYRTADVTTTPTTDPSAVSAVVGWLRRLGWTARTTATPPLAPRAA